MFWRNKKIASEEYADCLTKLVKLESELSTLSFRMEKLESQQNLMRGQVNARLSRRKQDDEDETDDLRREIDELKNFFGTPAEAYEASQRLREKRKE